MRRVGIAAAVLFVATVWLANWAIQKWGPVPVLWHLDGTPALYAPAGVYFAGAALCLRDVVHHTLGRWWVVVAILTGAALAYMIAPALALASACAFLVSELCDMLVYERLRARGWTPALVVSNIAGAIVDSALFLWLAFGSDGVRDYFAGQVVGKLWLTAPAVALIVLAKRRHWNWREAV